MVDPRQSSKGTLTLWFGDRKVEVRRDGGSPPKLVVEKGGAFRKARPKIEPLYRQGPFLVIAGSDLEEVAESQHVSISPLRDGAKVIESLPPRGASPTPASLVDTVNGNRIEESLRALAGISRDALYGNGSAASFLTRELRAVGWLPEEEPFSFEFEGGSYEGVNIVATRSGRGADFVIVCAHYDSIGDGRDDAWGADDNASGCAAVLELARVLPEELELGVELIFFDAEEPGLFGSHHHVGRHREALEEHCQGVLNLDTIGRRHTEDHQVLLDASSASAPIVAALREASDGLDLTLAYSSGPIPSDHRPFIEDARVPAALVAEADLGNSDRDGDGRADIHTSGDIPDYIDLSMTVEVTRLAAAYVASKVL